MRGRLTALLLLLATAASAQTTVTRTDILLASTRAAIGTATAGAGPLRVVGLSGSATGALLVVDASGDLGTAGTVNTGTTFSSTFQASGTANLYGSAIALGNATSDTVTFTARLAGHLHWAADDTYDIGGTASTLRPRDLFLSRNAAVGGTLGVTGVTTLTGALAANGGLTVDSTAFSVADTTGNTSIAGTLGVTGTTTIGDSANLTRTTYTSQTTGWRVSSDGGADFRYLFVDEMHAKSFIADLEQALAGGQIIAKSVAMVGQAFTCPATGSTVTLWVRDLPSMANTAAFVANDWVVLRSFSRAAGALTIAECVGQVSSYADGTAGNDGQQSWTFLRGTAVSGCGGAMSSGSVVAVDSLALDFGASGAGYAEVTAVDGTYGANSPYYQVVTWTTCPVAANRTLRARWGNLSGAYGYAAGSGVFGFAAGDASATYLTLEATNGLQMYTGATKKLWLTTAGALALYDSATTYLQLASGAINLVEGGVNRLALSGSGITVGPTATSHLTIDATNGLQFKNGSGTVLGSLHSSTLVLGQPLTANNTGQIQIDTDSIDLRWRNNSGVTSTMFEVYNNGGVGWVRANGSLEASTDVRAPTFYYAAGDMTLYTAGTGNYILVRTTGGGGLRPYTDNLSSLGNATTQWSAVYSESYYVGTTAGVSGTCSAVTVVNGIVTGCTP